MSASESTGIKQDVATPFLEEEQARKRRLLSWFPLITLFVILAFCVQTAVYCIIYQLASRNLRESTQISRTADNLAQVSVRLKDTHILV